MKKHFIVFGLMIFVGLQSFAQGIKYEEKDEVVEKGFKKENLFTGGNVNVSFGNNTTALGIGPFFGYSINKYLDVAASLNFNYVSQRDNFVLDDRIRQTTIGPGAFVRVFPVKFLFAQAQYEHNFIKSKYKYPPNAPNADEVRNIDANSFLVGGGFASGRSAYSKSYFYISVLFDVAKLRNSPYVDNLGRITPVIRAGYNIALFQGR